MNASILSTAPNSTDASRQPLTTIHNFPNHSSEVIHIQLHTPLNVLLLAVPNCFDSNGKPCLIVMKDGNATEDTPVATLPVPAVALQHTRTVKELEDLAMLECLRPYLAQRESGDVSLQPCSLQRVRTINKLEGFAMLNYRRAYLAQQESGYLASQACSSKCVRTANKLENA